MQRHPPHSWRAHILHTHLHTQVSTPTPTCTIQHTQLHMHVSSHVLPSLQRLNPEISSYRDRRFEGDEVRGFRVWGG